MNYNFYTCFTKYYNITNIEMNASTLIVLVPRLIQYYSFYIYDNNKFIIICPNKKIHYHLPKKKIHYHLPKKKIHYRHSQSLYNEVSLNLE